MPQRKRASRSTPSLSRNDVYAAVLGSPWAISPAGLELVFARAEQTLNRPGAVDAKPSDGVEHSWQLSKRDGVAQLRVYGPLVSADSWMRYYFTSYQELALELNTALQDASITALVLTFSSPGGHVAGCQELATILHGARGTKPIVAYVEGDACSAAYWLASACDEIVTNATGTLGCLGVQVAYLDDSKLLADWGLREIIVTSSQTPEKNRPPTDDEGRVAWQQLVDDLANVFLDTVAANRGLSRDVVDAQFGRGAVLVGQRAVNAGLADRLGTYESLHAELAAGTWRSPHTSTALPAAAAGASSTPTPTGGTTMAVGRKRAGAAVKPRAAAFETDAEVRVLVTRDVGVAEGDIGTITEVRDGSFYRVQVGEGEDTYAWLAEDEIEAASSTSDDPPADAPADESAEGDTGDEEDDDEQETASRRAKPSAFQSALTGARKAERARITGILALADKAPLSALRPLIDDPACTPEAAAHRLLTGKVKGARSTGLTNLAGDEAALDGLTGSGDTPTQSDAERILATVQQFNPRAVARKPRG